MFEFTRNSKQIDTLPISQHFRMISFTKYSRLLPLLMVSHKKNDEKPKNSKKTLGISMVFTSRRNTWHILNFRV